MAQWLLFLISLTLGGALRIVYSLMRLLQKKTALLPVTIILDGLFCVLCFVSYVSLSFLLASAQFYFFMLAGMGAGFFLCTIVFELIKETFKSRKAKKSKSST